MNRHRLREVAQRLGVDFVRPELLEQALTHKSYANEAPEVDEVAHNERLEFLGDAVLSLLVGQMLMEVYPGAHEGDLSRMRAALVNGEQLAEHADRLGLGAALRLGKGEERSGGRTKASILADAFEAVLAAAYLDGGLPAARHIVGRALQERIGCMAVDHATVDAKSRLQEWVQRNGGPPPAYALVASTGPDHDRNFQVEVRHADRVVGAGQGSSKKAAEQAAAQQALENLTRDAKPDAEPPEDA